MNTNILRMYILYYLYIFIIKLADRANIYAYNLYLTKMIQDNINVVRLFIDKCTIMSEVNIINLKNEKKIFLNRCLR